MSAVSTSSSTLYDMLIGQYKLESHYTQTAVSDLYLAKDINTQNPVALEVLYPSLSKSYCDTYVQKTQIAAKLVHANIAPIYDIGHVTENRPYIAREFIEGYQFSTRLKQLEEQKTPVNSIYALKMVRELADALALAESHQIYHHYLSPERLVLKYDGTLVLVDLGVPELPGGYKAYTSSAFNGPLPNNEYYLSPEQRNGKEINGRSHIYTLGIILHQLLTGLPPIAPPTRWQKLRGNYPQLQQLRPDLSPHLYELVTKCLHSESWRRYQNLAEFTAVLDATLEAETLFIQTGTALPTIATTKERRPWVYLAAPIFLVFACFIAAYAVINTSNINGSSLTQQFNKNTLVIAEPADQVVSNIPEQEENIQPSATDNELSPIDLPEQSLETTIQILEPLQNEKYKIGSTVVFTWTWPITLEANHIFTVYVADENGEKVVGQVKRANDQGVYELTINSASFASNNGIYLWHVVLQDEALSENLSVSATIPLRLVQDDANTPIPPTATPSSIPQETAVSPTRRPSRTPQPTAIITNTPRPTSTATAIRPTAVPPTTTPLPTATAVPPTAVPPTNVPPTNPPPPTAKPATAVPPTNPPPPTATIPPPPPPPATVPPPP